MTEVKFLTKRQGNVITVVNKNALYVVGEIMVEDGEYKVEGEKKPFKYVYDAIERLIQIASRV